MPIANTGDRSRLQDADATTCHTRPSITHISSTIAKLVSRPSSRFGSAGKTRNAGPVRGTYKRSWNSWGRLPERADRPHRARSGGHGLWACGPAGMTRSWRDRGGHRLACVVVATGRCLRSVGWSVAYWISPKPLDQVPQRPVEERLAVKFQGRISLRKVLVDIALDVRPLWVARVNLLSAVMVCRRGSGFDSHRLHRRHIARHRGRLSRGTSWREARFHRGRPTKTLPAVLHRRSDQTLSDLPIR